MSLSGNYSDAELVDQCNTGTQEEATQAFEALYTRHKDFVLRVAYRHINDPNHALDVLQDTFSYLLQRFPPAGEGLVLKAKLQTLLYTVARNCAITVHRKTQRSRELSDRDPDEFAAKAEADTDIERLLLGLSPSQREVVMLRFVDDMSLQDIAATLQVPLGTAKSRLNTAVRALRNSPYIKAFFEK